jgi:formate C-acetyltransferase
MKRYSDLALAIASKTRNLVRKGELQKISETCERLVISPPQTFYEALQAVWFLHSALYSQFLLLPFGRPDQYLYPFLKNDLDNGRLTMGEAQELIDLFVLKCCEPLKRYKRTLEAVQDSQHSDLNTNPISFERIAELLGAFSAYGGGKTTQDSIGLDGGTYTQLMQTVTLAGVKPNGEDATNSVSYLFLNSALRLKVPSPAMYLRLGDQSPAELLERAADCLRAGCVSPSIYSDKAIVPAYVKAGISLEDARQYAASGCQETYIEGKTYFKYGIISAAEAVSRVISPAYWERMVAPLIYLEEFDPCKEAGPDPRTFRSFEEVMSAVKMRLDQLVKGFIYSSVTLRDGRLSKISPEPLLSAVVPGPLDKGLDLTTEYAMPYSIHSPLLVGLSHAADSLAVIKKLCFDDCSVSISELLDAVDSNWEGSETLRQIVRTRVPAYGNDIDYVDNLAKELTDSYVQSMRSHSAKYSSRVIFLPGMFTGELYIALGKIIPALPDGRRAGEPLGTNGSPSIGRPERGEAAAINSFVKLPLDDLAGVCGLDIDMEGSAGSPARLAQLEYIIEAFSDAPGNLLTVTVNNCEDLRKAQKEPEKYRNLIVRVAGHLAYFVDLPPHHQERLIMRAEQYARGC